MTYKIKKSKQKAEEENYNLKKDNKIIYVTRAMYGQKNSTPENREYTVDKSGSSAVRTISELKAFFPNVKIIKIKDSISGDSVVRIK
jgi:hypothetical protein